MAYIDETGDTGLISNGGTGCYALGCVLLDDQIWPEAFDQMLAFRKRLSQTYRINQRWELKANYLTRGGGTIKALALPPGVRHLIYRGHLRMMSEIGARAFAVVIDKEAASVSGQECFHMAWETLLNRLERTSTKEKSSLMVLHDEGEDAAVRRESAKRAATSLLGAHLVPGSYGRKQPCFSTTQCRGHHTTRTSSRLRTWWPTRGGVPTSHRGAK